MCTSYLFFFWLINLFTSLLNHNTMKTYWIKLLTLVLCSYFFPKMTIVVVEDCTVYLACILRILSVKPCIVKSAHINMRKTQIISCCYWLSFFRYPIKLSLHVQNKMESVGSVPLKIQFSEIHITPPPPWQTTLSFNTPSQRFLNLRIYVMS